jgi:hypothetical protein
VRVGADAFVRPAERSEADFPSSKLFHSKIFSNCDVQPGLRNLDVELWDYASPSSQKTRHSIQAGCPISRILCEKWGFFADTGPQYSQAQQATKKAEPTTAPVGTAAIGCPGGPAVSVCSAVAPSALSPHGFTKPPAKPPQPSPASNRANSGALSAPRKPPTPVKEALSTGKSLKTRDVAAGQN